MKPLDSLAVANWFLNTARIDGQSITTAKVQKLVFFAHGWCLALYDQPLVTEWANVWPWGPGFRDIYDAAKEFGSGSLTSLLHEYFEDPPIVEADDPRIPLLQRIWGVYGKFTTSQLSRMAMEEDGPWDVTWQKYAGRKNLGIDEELIKLKFREKIEDRPSGGKPYL